MFRSRNISNVITLGLGFVILFCVLYNILQVGNFNYEVCKKIIQKQNWARSENLIEDENFKNGAKSCTNIKGPVAWIYAKNLDTGFLKHVSIVLCRLGYQVKTIPWETEGQVSLEVSENLNWDLLWTYEYPFGDRLSRVISNLKPHQKVNHFPELGHITLKGSLITSSIRHTPKAFKIPKQLNDLKKFAQSNPRSLFVQKNNNHRGIRIKDINDIDLTKEDSFVQQYVGNPLLIDGRKFDVGVYIVVTSFNPLRLYILDSECLVRFCPKDYLPFDSKDVDKYVIGDDYTPLWELPTISYYYNSLGMNFKQSLNAYLRSKGFNPEKMWGNVEEMVRDIFIVKSKDIVNNLKQYKGNGFFEMLRVDFVLDDDLGVYLMEVNMSPNLNSRHFPHNRFLYETVLWNTFSLVGQTPLVSSCEGEKNDAEDMMVSNRDIMGGSEVCSKSFCIGDTKNPGCVVSNYSLDRSPLINCLLCSSCLIKGVTDELVPSLSPWINVLKESHGEMRRLNGFKRIFPTISLNDKEIQRMGLSKQNLLLTEWYRQMCQIHAGIWCI